MFAQGFEKTARVAPFTGHFTMPNLHVPRAAGKATAAGSRVLGRLTDADYEKRILKKGVNRMAGTVKPGGVDSAIARYNQSAISKAMGTSTTIPASMVMKTAKAADGVAKAGQKIMGLTKNVASKVHYPLDQVALGTLGGIDAYDAYKAHKEGNKAETKKSLIGAAAMGGLMASTHMARRLGH